MADTGNVRQKVLLVEDDPSLAMGLGDALEFEGYQVIHAKTGKEGVMLAGSRKPDCVILDLMLPDINGYQVCERIRQTNKSVPILMLTARGGETDKIRGLDVGADDYVTKPFSVGELVARIRAILRRTGRGDQPSQRFRIGELTIDTQAQTLNDGRSVLHLSYYETLLLALLHERRGKPVSREEILDKVWGVTLSPNNRTVDNFIVKLRKKIEAHPDRPRYLLTVHGVGYKLVPNEAAK